MEHHYYVLIILWSILMDYHISSLKKTFKLATDVISISQTRKLNHKDTQHTACLEVR